MDSILQFLRDNPAMIPVLLAVLGALGALARWSYIRWQIRKYRGDDFPFHVIKPYSQVVSAIMDAGGSTDPLPPSSISYQQRAEDTNVQVELERQLEEQHWLLITAKTGWGKTREAAELAQRLNQRGWTVLNLIHTDLVKEPAVFPHEKIGADKKLLFVLDDLTNKLTRGKTESITHPGDPKQQLQAPLQDRLFRMLERYKGLVGDEQEIRVIATARSEPVRENPNDPSEWEKLQWDTHPRFWNKFVRYELPPPSIPAQFHLLKFTIQQTAVESALGDDDYHRLARSNDRTFRNLVVNIRNAKSDKRAFTAADFVPSLKGTWEKQYRDITKKYPAARYIYDAVDLLQTVDIDLYTFTVEPTARLIADGNLFQRFRHRLAIRRALPQLVQRNILTPADGQIQAKLTLIDVRKYILPNSSISPLAKLVLRIADRYPAQMLASLNGYGGTLYKIQQTEQAAALWRKGTELDPKSEIFWNNLGVALADLNRSADAEQAYRTAIELNPQYATAYNNLGLLLHEKLNRSADAEQAYRTAIELDPQYATAYNNLGNLLAKEANRSADAEQAYRTAIELNPQDATAYYNLGNLLHEKLNRSADAEQAYRTAIELNPQYATAYNNLGSLLHEKLNRSADAEQAYRTAIALNPQYATAYYNLGNLLDDMKKYADAEQAYRTAIALNPQDANLIGGVAYFLRMQNRFAEAEPLYRRALELDEQNPRRYIGLVTLLRQTAREPEALTLAEKWLVVAPNEVDALILAANLSRKLDRPNERDLFINRAREQVGETEMYARACIEAVAGNGDAALDMLKRASEDKDFDADWAKRDPDLEWIRDDPRFGEIVKTR